MSELFRMRIARSPQRHAVRPDEVTLTHPPIVADHALTHVPGPHPFIQELIAAKDPSEPARAKLVEHGLLPPARRVSSILGGIDAWLNLRNNDPNLEEFWRFIGAADAANAADAIRAWQAARAGNREIIGDCLVAAIMVEIEPDLRAHLTRLMSIFGLLEELLRRLGAGAAPGRILDILRWRTIAFPTEVLALLALLSRRRFVVRVGVSDLYVTRTEWIAYKAGEVAHIENLLPGELKERRHIKLDEREETRTEETTTATVSEQESESTDRFESQEDAQHDAELDLHVEGQVDTSGQYGPTKVDTHLGGSLDYSTSDSMRQATTQANETVTRTVARVEKSVRRARTQRTLTRIEETNTHSLKNDTGGPISGIYRWVDKVQRFQIFRYPNRLLLEFQIPEPAAWITWLVGQRAPQKTNNRKPEPFTADGEPESAANKMLTAKDITDGNYLNIGARYNTFDMQPPPPTIFTTKSFVQDTKSPREPETIKKDDPLRFIKLDGLTVAEGYVATKWWARVMSWGETAFGETRFPTIVFMLGNESAKITGPTGEKGFPVSAVSARETDRGFSGTEDFWIIVAIRSEDETETRAGESAGRADRQRHPARDASAFFG